MFINIDYKDTNWSTTTPDVDTDKYSMFRESLYRVIFVPKSAKYPDFTKSYSECSYIAMEVAETNISKGIWTSYTITYTRSANSHVYPTVVLIGANSNG